MQVYVVASIGCLECSASSSIELVTTDRTAAEKAYLELNNQDSRYKRKKILRRPEPSTMNDWAEDPDLVWGEIGSDYAYLMFEKEMAD